MDANLAALCMVSLLALTGCEGRISPANIDGANRQQEAASRRTGRAAQVKEGLTPKEVESILGHPARVETEKRPIIVQKHLEVAHWFYEQDGKTIELTFVNGALQHRIPQFGETPASVTLPPAVLTPSALGAATILNNDDAAR